MATIFIKINETTTVTTANVEYVAVDCFSEHSRRKKLLPHVTYTESIAGHFILPLYRESHQSVLPLSKEIDFSTWYVWQSRLN